MHPELKKIIEKSRSIVFFGGAGVSTESNIPDFRSESGLYNAVQNYGYSPEEMLSYSFYSRKPELFFKYYKENLIYREAEPNDAHKALARLEEEGKLSAVVTQNIDGLHQNAGNKYVYELHGSVLRNYCTRCGKFYDAEYIVHSDGVPKCECGGVIKPDVVLYEEGLDQNVLRDSINAISNADVVIVGGTSLAVYPAAGLIDYYRGDKLILVNKTATPMDKRADLVVQGNIGEIFSQL